MASPLMFPSSVVDAGGGDFADFTSFGGSEQTLFPTIDAPFSPQQYHTDEYGAAYFPPQQHDVYGGTDQSQSQSLAVPYWSRQTTLTSTPSPTSSLSVSSVSSSPVPAVSLSPPSSLSTSSSGQWSSIGGIMSPNDNGEDPCGDGVDAKRLKHRHIDAIRRQREVAALSRLQAVCFDSAEAEARARARSKSNKPKVDRVSTLTAAVDKIEELTRMVEQLKRRHNERSDAAVVDAASAVRPQKRYRDETAVDVVTHRLIDQSFLASLIHNSAFAHVLIDEQTGLCLYVNKTFTDCTGWKAELVLNQIFCPPSALLAENPLARFDTKYHVMTPTVTFPNGEKRRLPKPPQSPETDSLLFQLFARQTDQIFVKLRQYHYDGHLMETHLYVRAIMANGRRFVHFTCHSCNETIEK